MQKMIRIYGVVIFALGIVEIVLVKTQKIQQGVLILAAPMIMIGIWLFAYSMSRRDNGNTR